MSIQQNEKERIPTIGSVKIATYGNCPLWKYPSIKVPPYENTPLENCHYEITPQKINPKKSVLYESSPPKPPSPSPSPPHK